MKRSTTSREQDISGTSVIRKLGRASWISQYEDTETASNRAFHQIGTVLSRIGNWNYRQKVLDVQAGLGVMVQLLNDHGYRNVKGTEGDEVREFWENKDELIICEPTDIPVEDEEYAVSTWFSMCDKRVEESFEEEVIEEMIRVTKFELIIKPYPFFEPELDKKFVSFMLGKRMRLAKFVPELWYYIFVKD